MTGSLGRLGKAWGSEAGKWMQRLSSRCTRPFRIFTLISLLCLAAAALSRHYLQALLVRPGSGAMEQSVGDGSCVGPGDHRFQRISPQPVAGVSGRLGHPDAVWVLDGSDFPTSRAGSRWGWPASTAGGLRVANCVLGIRSPLTRGFICLRAGPRTRNAVRRRGCQPTRLPRQRWPWLSWSGH